MTKIYIIFCSLLFSMAFGQQNEKKIYSFYAHLDHYSNSPQFENVGGLLRYVGKDKKEKEFFSRYQILAFSQAFPSSRREKNLNVFTVISYDESLIRDLKSSFGKYLLMRDLTGIKLELANSYPNDYGTTSPVTNLGVTEPMKHLDYIQAPKAWDVTTGDPKILIGISDANVDTTDIDFHFKTERLPTHQSVFPAANVTYFNANDPNTWHGTSTAAFAAAQGNNGHGMAGVCYDCSILLNSYGSYNHILDLAIAGARVVNMSWGYFMTGGGLPEQQEIINEIVECYGTVLVAGAGNRTSFSTPASYHPGYPNHGVQYFYPASYNHVISVSGVNHMYASVTDTASYCCTSPWFPVHQFVEDSVSPAIDGTDLNNPVGVTQNGYYAATTNPLGLVWMHTLNEDVDILAPSYNIFQYPWYKGGHSLYYGYGTSGAAPQVTGTVGLMLSLDTCLNYLEVEDILQLAAKDVEHMPINQAFYGMVGAGKLETGDAVEFVDQMNKFDGNAKIDNHIFYRFDFLLNRIDNKLTIENVVFKDSCTADFTARNIIDVLPGSDFNPDEDGFVDLKIDENIDMGCTPLPRAAVSAPKKSKKALPEAIAGITKLSPNPNNGSFSLSFAKDHGQVNIEVFDIYGKIVYRDVATSVSVDISIPNISSGMYMVKLSSDSYNETIKFIKK